MSVSESSSLWQAAPFAGLLLSIALGPLLLSHFWHANYGKVAIGWSLLAIWFLVEHVGGAAAFREILTTLIDEYVPFILLMFALFTAAGGLLIRFGVAGSVWSNAGLLALGAGLASLIGTTGASMILIRPLIVANQHRPHNAHVVIFFIFLVSNIGGLLLPMGDPPLFLGFLQGVDFFWTLLALWPHFLLSVAVLLLIFVAIDWYLFREPIAAGKIAVHGRFTLHGGFNILLLLLVVVTLIVSGKWHPGVGIDVFGVSIPAEALLRDAVLALIGFLSLAFTKQEIRRANGFDFEPLREVAELFAAIFICIIPVMALLHQGEQGPFGFLIQGLDGPDGKPLPGAYFWVTGLLSAFLDNAPTYLLFFQLAGGDPQILMGDHASILKAISFAAVSMGALTYIGNAPNFMVYAIARKAGIRMPSFLGYMLWSCGFLLPLFGAMTWLFFGKL
ncbi:sodium:proton antiporter [Beijerinckia mobilis]|uniref:sodium:proton antiporter n=1 Tax=Beijerinckia mobilis TaxID=231434 RepID=UPI000551C26E|nr:sodium:proton antiporter [Beijerinckia mobilis]